MLLCCVVLVFFFFLSQREFHKEQEIGKDIKLALFCSFLLERAVILSCNSLNFLFLKRLFDFKLVIQFGALDCRGKGKEGDFLYCKDAIRI